TAHRTLATIAGPYRHRRNLHLGRVCRLVRVGEASSAHGVPRATLPTSSDYDTDRRPRDCHPARGFSTSAPSPTAGLATSSGTRAAGCDHPCPRFALVR